MCAISLQYDQHNPAAIKMLDAILEAGLFTVCEHPTLKKFTMEELNRDMDKVELDFAQGRLVDQSVARQRRHEFVQKYAQS